MLKLLGFGELFCGTRAAKKVFLEFLEPFSSEKGSKPPEALAAKPRKRVVVKNAQKATKDDEKTD